ncbi:sugar ABC transporter ATP-binding protein, partial [Klebsiella pneumoniae]
LELPLAARAADLPTVHKRLLMLARALDRHPRLLILDEPTAGLAAHEARLVTETVSQVVATGVSVIYISHHLTEVAELC